MSLITIIGRGHSGTRAMSHTLSESGIHMGGELNESGDLIPPEEMYEACRVLAKRVEWKGDLDWDFSRFRNGRIDSEFERLVRSYLKTVLDCPDETKGWKIPETTLAYPWIVRMFPDAKYIFWIRNPVDCILGSHVTDDLRDFHIEYPETEDEVKRRAVSWQYQYELMKATPQPENWIEVRFEDFILEQDKTLARLESFLGFKLTKIPVRPESVGRWRQVENPPFFDFLRPAMEEYGYEIPMVGESLA